ncbi:tlde1 domain-containing protein [Methylobacterium pseudosasicola]|uniref:Tlde1 domain-containing protein n=1 Tax=Methylobacterium pseudosasicola TaxID=582667 RepID=A0A1I4QZZ0_9HYPH|nr:tlde1 domain-containing protein [Methylobacterium pseudosasicola]SFM45270.1 Protein of unknown function [Methylobacterium pseudosasicola]
MAIDPAPLDGPTTRTSRRGCAAPLAVLTAAVALAALGSGLPRFQSSPAIPLVGIETSATTVESPGEAATLAANPEPSATEAWREATGGPLSRWAWTQIEPPAPTPIPDEAPAPEAQDAEPPRAAMTVPLPMPRPPEFRFYRGPDMARRSERRVARRELPPVPIPPREDDRSFLEKLFGVERAPALAYAALESRPADLVPQRRISPPLAPTDARPTAGTAVYNIAARVVTLPNGERLEAHSGLGEGFDEPRLVNVRMRGPTPPGTYDLKEREQLFHGVRAIRLTPVGGPEAVYGRVGLLAHTFMLGQRGDSNGCVSFRDYDRFLQAFLRGEVQRLVVVAGTQDPLPSLAETPIRTRIARNGT